MKSRLFIACFLLLSIASYFNAQAQYLPVVFNNTYQMSSISKVAQMSNTGDMVAIGKKAGVGVCVWLDREGGLVLSKEFNGQNFSEVNEVVAIDDSRVLVLGSAQVKVSKKSSGAAGRALVLNVDGTIEKEFEMGDENTTISGGMVLSNEDYLFWGKKQNIGYNKVNFGYLARFDKEGTLLFEYTSEVGDHCAWVKENETTSRVVAVFNGNGERGCSVISLNRSGNSQFITNLEDPTYMISNCIFKDGYIILSGHGNAFGSAVVKIRPEGDVVFVKNVVDGEHSDSRLDHMLACKNGDLLVAATQGKQSVFSVLRSDGTSSSKLVFAGKVTAMASNPATGGVVLALYEEDKRRGSLVKVSEAGKKLFVKPLISEYSNLTVDANDDIILASTKEGRISMMSSFGELMYDRYIDENRMIDYTDVWMTKSGEVICTNGEDNITKMAHGLYIDDVVITKPMNGITTAIFNVTLSGFAYSDDGAPMPVTVRYKTVEKTANAKDNFKTVEGELSFIPKSVGKNQYLTKEVIEVPILSNNAIEGQKEFFIQLTGASNSYIIKNEGLGTIEDQQGVVKLVKTEDGIEGQKDVKYELGLFKSNGEKLTNKTGADVVIDGQVGEGTADELDYDTSRLPQLKISDGKHSGVLSIPTVEDTRYEMSKSLYVNFEQIKALSGTNIVLPSSSLNCEGKIQDQPASITITSLGSQSQSSTSISSFAKIELRRAKDGAVQTNHSGADILVGVEINEGSSAKKGIDFAFVNAHDLKIVGDGKHVSVNLNGIVIYNPESNQDKEVSLKLSEVNQVEGAGEISIDGKQNQCRITVKQRELVK
ncbi:MAG: Calx-beta domain-containing protein [Mangrovibacterium sp.]